MRTSKKGERVRGIEVMSPFLHRLVDRCKKNYTLSKKGSD